jgi:PleD family two-component response regulator
VKARASSDASSPPGGDDRQARVRVLIVDDNPAFRSLVRELLTRSGFDVVGEAGGAVEALAEFSRLRPRLCLLTIRFLARTDSRWRGGSPRRTNRLGWF